MSAFTGEYWTVGGPRTLGSGVFDPEPTFGQHKKAR